MIKFLEGFWAILEEYKKVKNEKKKISEGLDCR